LGPEVDDEDDVAPEVSEHLGDHGQGPLERLRETVLVLVHDQERIYLLHLKFNRIENFYLTSLTLLINHKFVLSRFFASMIKCSPPRVGFLECLQILD
jgi:hypothetical protein